MLNIAGTEKDDSELPFAFNLLGLHVGLSFAGNIVQPGQYFFEMTFEYRTTSLTDPLLQYPVGMPEPSSARLVGTIIGALATVSRMYPAKWMEPHSTT